MIINFLLSVMNLDKLTKSFVELFSIKFPTAAACPNVENTNSNLYD